jgi:hypothetical protein
MIEPPLKKNKQLNGGLMVIKWWFNGDKMVV